MTIIQKIKNDPRVKEAWSEGEDGWWVSLKAGNICGESGTHCVHEWSLADLRRSFRSVKPCQCADCITVK